VRSDGWNANGSGAKIPEVPVGITRSTHNLTTSVTVSEHISDSMKVKIQRLARFESGSGDNHGKNQGNRAKHGDAMRDKTASVLWEGRGKQGVGKISTQTDAWRNNDRQLAGQMQALTAPKSRLKSGRSYFAVAYGP
jgi:hypothetical protein